MREAVAFLHGVYRKRDLPFYKTLLAGRTTIAVDGGYNFFRRTGVVPDILLGDFDSLKRIPRNLPKSTEVLRFPSAKDKTDAHLAVDYCLSQNARVIDIVMPHCGEIDHALGSVLLLGLEEVAGASNRKLRIRIVNTGYEIRLASDSSVTFQDCRDEVISVLPLTKTIRLTCTGTEFNVRHALLHFGDSRGLRNRITGARATVRVTGRALVVHQFSRRP